MLGGGFCCWLGGNLAILWFNLNFRLFYDREKEPRSNAVAVPSPGHKKSKNFRINQGITENLNFTCFPYNASFFAGKRTISKQP